MKTKEQLLGDYRELAEHQSVQKDAAFLEVLIDIRDLLSAVEKLMRTMHDRPGRSGLAASAASVREFR
jgi:hypothetical protein